MEIMKLRTVLLLVGLPLGLATLGLTIPNADAQTVTILYSFGVTPNDGKGPAAGLVQGSDGNFYGTTVSGGMSESNGYSLPPSYGTVFRISPSGSYTTLYQFAGYPNDGQQPRAGLVQGTDGNFYGTTGEAAQLGPLGLPPISSTTGTVFRISPSGSYTNLYFFGSHPNDGQQPRAGLVQGSDRDFYGTTYEGGNAWGTVFRISSNGSETNLHSFDNNYPNDGALPSAGLVQGRDGNFYGTTQNGAYGFGTVFRISPSGIYTNLHAFFDFPFDGYYPEAGLVQGSDGNFYGTTPVGGIGMFDRSPPSGYGTVFRISPSGTFTTLYSFAGSPNDGANPVAGLVQGSDGNFYGTTEDGGANNNVYCLNGCGTVFRISPSGSYTTLHSFGGYPNDGSSPEAGLVQGSDGNFYGTTFDGRAGGTGTVFKLTVPLNPPPYPINQITSIHIADEDIIFTIPSIAGETYQLQFRSSMTPFNWIDVHDRHRRRRSMNRRKWVNVPGVSVTNSIGALLTVTNFGGASQQQGFYRFDITP
jgi:uncharacterized repeat protein (TIGR03803 family)